MRKANRALAERAQDILDAIAELEEVASFDVVRLIKEKYLLSHAEKQIWVIGAASKSLEGAMRKSHPNVPWRALTKSRNQNVRDYFHTIRPKSGDSRKTSQLFVPYFSKCWTNCQRKNRRLT